MLVVVVVVVAVVLVMTAKSKKRHLLLGNHFSISCNLRMARMADNIRLGLRLLTVKEN